MAVTDEGAQMLGGGPSGRPVVGTRLVLLGRVEGGRMKFEPVPMELGKFCRSLCDEVFSATGGGVV